MVMSRRVVVENMNDIEILLKECSHLTPPGFHGYTIELPPFGHREVPATIFHDRNLGLGRPATIVPYVDGREITSTFLVAQDFVRYVKLRLYLDGEGGLIITGIEPRFTDFGRFWGLGFLGREYRGRPEEIIR